MLYVNVISLLLWAISSAGVAVSWWLGEPFGPGARFFIGTAVFYSLLRIATDAAGSVADELAHRQFRHLDRRPQI